MPKPPPRLQNSLARTVGSGRCMTPYTKIRINWACPYCSLWPTALVCPRPICEARWRPGSMQPKVKADFLGGVRSGVNGTPAFFINGELSNGTFEFDDLVASIELRLQPGRPCNLGSVLSRPELSKLAAPRTSWDRLRSTRLPSAPQRSQASLVALASRESPAAVCSI